MDKRNIILANLLIVNTVLSSYYYIITYYEDYYTPTVWAGLSLNIIITIITMVYITYQLGNK